VLQHLDGNTLVEVTLGAVGFVDVAHAAATDAGRDAPSVEACPDCQPIIDFIRCRPRRLRQEVANRCRGAQKAGHLRAHRGVRYRQALPTRLAGLPLQVEQLVEEGIDLRLLLF